MARKKATSKSRGASTHVALLRGINVGGNNLLPMAELSAMFAKAGASDIRTYIQSGNVVYSASTAQAAKIGAAVSDAIEKKFKFRPTIVLRTADEMAKVAVGNPFLVEGTDSKLLYVGFLVDVPSATQIAKIDPKRSPADRFIVRGREMFVHYPNGVANSKFTNAYIDSALATTSTFRNWRTVLKLVEMSQTKV